MASDNPIVFHSIIHRQVLYCIFSLKTNECKGTVMLTVDHSRPKGLKHCQLKIFLKEVGPEYDDAIGYSVVI